MYATFTGKIAALIASFSTSHRQVVFELLVPTCKKLRREYDLLQGCPNNSDTDLFVTRLSQS